MKDDEKLLAQLRPIRLEPDKVMIELNAYCSRAENSDKPLALSLAEIVKQKGH